MVAPEVLDEALALRPAATDLGVVVGQTELAPDQDHEPAQSMPWRLRPWWRQRTPSQERAVSTMVDGSTDA
jgi:hypothetical protein